MENSIEQYTTLGVSLVVAVAVLVMFSSFLGLRREAQIILENKAYFRELSQYKQKFDGFDNTEISAVEALSVITQFAEELDIYVYGTSYKINATLLITDANRYLLEYEEPSDADVRWGWGHGIGANTYAPQRAIDLAKQYGTASAQALGQMFYGDVKWQLELCYDNMDVTQAASAVKPSPRSQVTGIRLIRK